jgi:RNA polymerase sigma-70 factor (ECF subfamily)
VTESTTLHKSDSQEAQRQAFAVAYREHLSWMLHAVRRLGVTPAEREDVVHDVFSTAWRKIESYLPDRPMRPWLFGIAFRVVANRKAARTGSETLEAEFDARRGAVGQPDSLVEAEVTRQNIQRALEQIPLEQRALFIGHDIDQTPITELARELEIPLNTAYSRLRLARDRFQKVFDTLQGGAP